MNQAIEFLKPDFEFEDERGYLRQLCREGWRQINVSFSRAGVLRGGHYHKQNREAFYIICGKAEIELNNAEEDQKLLVKAGDYFVLNPPAKHSFRFLEDTLMLAMYDLGVETAAGEKDIYND